VIAIVIMLSVLACGTWLRYGVAPVLFAYWIGRRVERLIAARRRA
jgi:hypothetical protein